MPLKPSNYRPDIDGLRAIAILGVLIFHIDESWLSGGFVGVDVFFVISGYLITAIVYREIEAKRFSLLGFYERRIRRIMPALFVLLAVLFVISYWLLLPRELRELAKSTRYLMFSVSNFHFAGEVQNYFAAESSKMPLLHTWSLSVEEQFYFVFPFLMALGYRLRGSRRALTVGALVIGLVSLGLSQWMVYYKPIQAFYMLPWRAWEMLCGSILALGAYRPGRRWVAEVGGILGLGMICGSMIWFGATTDFPGFSALLPCLGATLLIFSGSRRDAVTPKILGVKPLVFLGLISYSTYLWHWPIIVLYRYFFGQPDLLAGVVVFVSSLLLGYLSWRFVERPFRNPSFLTRKRAFAIWGAVAACFVIVAVIVKNGNGFPERFSKEIQGYMEEWPRRFRSNIDDHYNLDLAPSYGADGGVPNTVIWGDSHAQALLPVLEQLASESGTRVLDYGMHGQPGLPGVTIADQPDAKARDQLSWKVFHTILKDDRIKLVIIHYRWNTYFHGNREDSRPGPYEVYGQSFQSDDERMTFIERQLHEAVTKFTAAGKTVVLVYPVPEPGEDIPDRFMKAALMGKSLPDKMFLEGVDTLTRETRILIDAYRDVPGVILIDPETKMMEGNQLTVRVNGRLLYRDDDHLSVPGSFYLRDLFEPVFKRGNAR